MSITFQIHIREGSAGIRHAVRSNQVEQFRKSWKGIFHVVSVSGGKDSAATLLLAIERFGVDRVVGIFCDTGNEHEEVYAYLDYLQATLGVKIHRLRANFDHEIARKRRFIARDRRTRREYTRVPKVDRAGNPVWLKDKAGLVRMFPVFAVDADGAVTEHIDHYAPRQKFGWNSGEKVRWTNKAKRRALAVLYPTGNPFLDLCLWKGRFPSRRAQFCTEELKRNIAVEFQLGLIEEGYTVISWQGVRRDESMNRRNAKQCDAVGGGLFNFRPLVDWTAMQVFAYCASKGISPNPLYTQGMGRVGCMPCINSNKKELQQIGLRFPDHIQRISGWESRVLAASKRGGATFIPAENKGRLVQNSRQHALDNDIHAIIKWAQTSRGGKQYSLLTALEEATSCSSSYGLCE